MSDLFRLGKQAGMSSEITILLQRWQAGDDTAVDALMPLVYSELHRIAEAYLRRQRPGHTLQPTALVNEACIKMFENNNHQFADRAHFLAVLSRAMRQVLIDHARAGAAEKRGGGGQKVAWDTNIEIGAGEAPRQLQMLELDRVLTNLTKENPALGRVVEMHYFGGMTADEVASVVGRTSHAVRHDLRAARAWLRRELVRA